MWNLKSTLVPPPANHDALHGTCWICLADDCDDLVHLGCGCRGDTGKAHFDCMYQLCKAKHERTAAPSVWNRCSLCSVRYSDVLQEELLFERCRQNEALVPDSEEALSLADMLANCIARRGDVDAAADIYDEILPILHEYYGPDAEGTLNVTSNYTEILRQQGRHEEAVEMCREILPLMSEVEQGDMSNKKITQLNLVSSLVALEQYAEAEVLLRAVIADGKRDCGAEFPGVVTLSAELADVLAYVGRFDDSVLMYQETLATCKRVFGSTHATTTSTMLKFAIMLCDVAGKPEEAEPMFRSIVCIAKERDGELSDGSLSARRCIQVALREQKHFDKAVAECRSFLALCKQGDVDQSTECVVETKMALGALLCDCIGKPAEAELIFRDVLEQRQQKFGFDHPAVHAVFQNLCVSLFNQDNNLHMLKFLDEYLESYASECGKQAICTSQHMLDVAFTRSDLLFEYFEEEFDDAEDLKLQTILMAQEALLGGSHEDTMRTQDLLEECWG